MQKMTRKEFRDYLFRTDRKAPQIDIPPNKGESLKLNSANYFAMQATRSARHKKYPVFCRNKEVGFSGQKAGEKKPGILARINQFLGGTP